MGTAGAPSEGAALEREAEARVGSSPEARRRQHANVRGGGGGGIDFIAEERGEAHAGLHRWDCPSPDSERRPTMLSWGMAHTVAVLGSEVDMGAHPSLSRKAAGEAEFMSS